MVATKYLLPHSFILTCPRGGYAFANLIEAQQLILLASRPIQLSPSRTYGRSNSLPVRIRITGIVTLLTNVIVNLGHIKKLFFLGL